MSIQSKLFPFLLLAALATSCAHSPAQKPAVAPVTIAPRSAVEAHGKKWIISTQGKHTTEIAAQVMKGGGNLVDAAIAASFAISVERPHSTGIGGGGFLIYHEAKTGKNFVYDFRERAPALATRNMYLDSKGEVIENKSLIGSFAVGTPGLVRGLAKIHRRFGRKPWASLVRPAAALARNGFEIYPTLVEALEDAKPDLVKFPSSRAIFFREDGSTKGLGEKLVQEDLARTLERLARDPDDFYRGETARKIVAAIRAQKGLLSANDLSDYEVKERRAVEANWRGYHLVSMPPPSSGGIHVLQILKLLEKDRLTDSNHGFLAAPSLHLIASSMQMAFADRAVYLGDPDFVKVPVHGLLEEEYLLERRAEIPEARARTQKEVLAGHLHAHGEGEHTTHFSMMDAEGNVVVSTQTINGWFGSCLVADGTGIVLNNEMDDFSAKPGVANLFGAVGGDANAVAPRKTPLSSMSPTIVFKNGVPVLAVGAPGGTRIITSVAQTILNRLVFGKDLYSSVAAARIHQQWSPDKLFVERSALAGARDEVSVSAIAELERMGWRVERSGARSHVMVVAREPAADGTSGASGVELIGVSDPRDFGTSAGE